jgi:hypothetical protein
MMAGAVLGPWRPANETDRSRRTCDVASSIYQDRPRINAKWQRFKVWLSSQSSKGQRDGSVSTPRAPGTPGVVPLSYEYNVGTHTQTDTQIQSHTVSHTCTHSTHSPIAPSHSTDSLNFGAISVNDGRALLGPWTPANDRSLSDVLHLRPSFIKIGPGLTKWQRFKVWLFTH